MKNLKEKLSASVRQARTATATPGRPAAKKATATTATKRVAPPAAARPAARKTGLPAAAISVPVARPPTAPLARAAPPRGFAHPDQVWPD
jgi:hypothetical protein